ncbi:FAD-linked oxidoreductase-like protein [Halteromyces radiatus]|uniref:FAD-linked oxidoreductase-like protein n=1 Tax=Halteromyces radiatus TaxID=101107 RepID=UPI00221FABCC|nr:FAD-linked oxidoreductase-like protein [Halteromyces radiatus]KAI8086763.1 FAD-linked oxidoreductase-like protein [Halteromyces radiatus]
MIGMYRPYLSRTIRFSPITSFNYPTVSRRLFHPQRAFFHGASQPKSSSGFVQGRKMMTSIAAATTLITVGSLFYPSVQAEASPSISAFSQPTAMGTIHDLLDDENRTALDVRSTEELLIGLFVYKLCTFPWIVDMAPHVIHLAEKLHLESLVYGFVKETFFRQFCGGETPEECVKSMDKLAQSGIRCILDLSVEADLHLEQADVPQMYDELSQPLGKWWRQEQSADVIVTMTEHCVRTAARGSNRALFDEDEDAAVAAANSNGGAGGAFAAIKVTAFAPPELLLRLNHVITRMEHIFQAHQVDGMVGTAALKDVVSQVLPPAHSDHQQQQRDAMIEYMHQQHPNIDSITFSQLFNLQGPSRDIWWATDPQTQESDTLLTLDELNAYDRMVNRLDQVCSLAHRYRVGIMVDAEQSYFQEAIDHVAMNLQAKYNRRDDQDHTPTVYNTYQMYTKAARAKLERDVELARRENFAFAAKLVRGAYMVSERKRAMQLGYPSPIHDTLEDTHDSFNGGVKFLLGRLHHHQMTTGEPLSSTTAPIVFMVATHNRDSVVQTVEEMDKQGVLPRSGVVHFGQLFGMQDQISYSLGKNGYSIYKYLPYGMIDEVIPYLLRRAQENSSVMGGVNKERALMWTELKDRIRARLPLAGGTPAPSTSSAPSSVVISSASTAAAAATTSATSATTSSTADDTESPIQTTTA